MNENVTNEFQPSDPALHAIAAKYAYIAGNMEESMKQLGYALVHDALCAKHLSLLDKIAANLEQEGIQLGAIRQNDHYSTIAVRAYLLAHSGRYTAAIILLIHVLAIQPDSPFTVWAIQWAQDSAGSSDLDVDAIALVMLGLLHRHGRKRKQNLTPVVTLVQALCQNHPKQARLMCTGAKILRQSSQLEDALSLANKAFALSPSFSTAVEVAYCYRQLGNLSQASQAFQSALRFDSNDLSRRTEFGDLPLRAEKIEQGLRILDTVIEENKEQSSPTVTLLDRLSCVTSFPTDIQIAVVQ